MMNAQGIKGKDQTPFLLKTIVELTGGNSLESNIKLVFNNCKLAAEIVKEYSNL
jgi:pseudouridine-5'-phosphate glycosidase